MAYFWVIIFSAELLLKLWSRCSPIRQTLKLLIYILLLLRVQPRSRYNISLIIRLMPCLSLKKIIISIVSFRSRCKTRSILWKFILALILIKSYFFSWKSAVTDWMLVVKTSKFRRSISILLINILILNNTLHIWWQTLACNYWRKNSLSRISSHLTYNIIMILLV